MRLWIGISLLVVILLSSCSRPTSELIWEGTCDQHRLAIYRDSHPRFDVTSYSHRYVFDDISFSLDQADVFHELPYDEDVYGDAAWWLLPGSDQAGDSQQVKQAMLYIPPEVISEVDFKELAECLELLSTEYGPVLANQSYLLPYRVAGVVRGEEDQFVERFFRNKDDVLEIDPDGTVQFVRDGSLSPMGLESKVQMPGRVLVIHSPTLTSPDSLREYRNSKDQTVDVRFQVKTMEPD